MHSKLVRRALLAGAVLAMPALASAQAPGTASVPATPAAPAVVGQEGGYQPAVLRFDAKGLTLLDAVRLALQNDPNVRLRDVDVERQSGVLREQRGAFDLLFRGTGDLQYARTEMRDSDKRGEIIKREQMDKGIAAGERLLPSVNAAVTNIQNPALFTNPGSVDVTRNVTDADVRVEVEIIKSQMMLVNDLLARTSDANVRRDLEKLRNDVVTAGLTRFEAARKELNTSLEEARRLRRQLGDAPIDQWDQSGNVRLEFPKPTRSGLVLTPFFSFNYSDANYVGKSSWDPEWGGLGVKPFYKAQLGFDLLVPLLRGRGRADAAANEMAAERDLEVTRLNLLHQKSRTVLDVALAYWNARAAAEQVEVARRSVEMQTQFADMIRKLVAAKEKARADETRVTASLADAQARYENAQRTLVEARIDLARVMGVALADAQAIPLAADAFPLPAQLAVNAASIADLSRQALVSRADLKAAQQSQEAGKILARGAQLQTRRQVNLTLSGWGTSASEDSPQWDRWVFRSGRAALDFELPFGNDTARGRWQQAVAALHQAEINSSDAARTVALNVQRAADSLRLAADRVTWAQEAAIAYDQTVVDEQQRLRLGDATLVDLILTEQQTTAARLSLVQALQDYASLLARLRYEAGLLIADSGGQSTVSFDNLMTVPPSLQKR